MYNIASLLVTKYDILCNLIVNTFLNYIILDNAKLLKEPNLVVDLKALINKENEEGKRFIIARNSNYNNKTDLKEIHAIYKGEYLNETL